MSGGNLIPLDTNSGIVVGGTSAFSTEISGHFDDWDRYFIAWTDQRVDAYTDIFGARISDTGALVDPTGGFLISRSANRQWTPAIEKCGSRYLVAWSDARNGTVNTDIYGSLLNANGSVAVSSLPITTAAGHQDQPDIACNGTDFYVTWVDERNGNKDIYANGINATTGARLFGSDVVIANTAQAEDHPSIAFGANQYEIVYDHVGTTVRGARVNASTGARIDWGTFISERSDINPDVAFDGTNFLVVAERTVSSVTDVVGTFVSPTNVVGTTFMIENAAAVQDHPRVAWDGAYYTVIYEDDRNAGTNASDIYGRRVQPNGTVLTAFGVATSTENEYDPQLSQRSGTQLEVTYFRGAATTWYEFGVWGQSLSAGVLSGSAFAISNVAGIREANSRISCISATSCVVPYRWFSPTDTTTDVDRIKARVVTFP